MLAPLLSKNGTDARSRRFVITRRFPGVAPLLLAVLGAFLALPGRAQQPGTKLWAFQTGGKVISSPALGADGTIYVGSDDYNLYALSPTGAKRWSFAASDVIEAAPVVAPDGTIYVGSYDGTLYALGPDGTERWQFPTGNKIMAPAALAVDGTVYIVSADGNLYALSPNGSQKWTFKTGTFGSPVSSFGAPSVGLDGTVYVASSQFLGTSSLRLNALNPDGTVRWSFRNPSLLELVTSPVIGSDGTVYAATSGGFSYALDATTGTNKFNPAVVTWTGAIGGAGALFAPDYTGDFLSLRPNGERKWILSPSLSSTGLVGHATATPALASDGSVYFGTDKGVLYSVSNNGSILWIFPTGSAIHSSPVIGTNGVVYFGADDGNLYAVEASAPLASTAWPMYRQNAQHTGALWNTILPATNLGIEMFPGVAITGSLGNSWRIEYSQTLSGPWSFLANVIIDKIPYWYFDVNATNAPQRFYRAILLP
jgi:outer membrane protein assembly factor BamB